MNDARTLRFIRAGFWEDVNGVEEEEAVVVVGVGVGDDIYRGDK